MTFQIQSTSIFNAPSNASGGWFRQLISKLMTADKAYQDARGLQRLTDEQLHDVGLSREQHDAAFYSKYGRGPANDTPTVISRGSFF